MKKIHTPFLLFIVLLVLSCQIKKKDVNEPNAKSKSYLKIVFEDSDEYQFSNAEKELIKKTAVLSDEKIRNLLPNLTKELSLKVIPVNYDLDIVNGVTGRANTPHEVTAEISYTYKDGVIGAVKQALSGHIYHEFHHVWRGWTLTENKFKNEIPIAAVNEGLADVFSKTYTGVSLEIGSDSDDLMSWTQEVLKLKKDADYHQWMNQHNDGRIAIGYRVGTFIVERALENSEMTIIELSSLQPKEIIKIAGLHQ